jgi:integrase
VDESTGCTTAQRPKKSSSSGRKRPPRSRIHGDPAVRTFADAALSYITGGGDGQHLEPHPQALRPKHAGQRDIGQAEIEECRRQALPQAGPATQNRKVYTPISAVLHHAARKKWCNKPVIGSAEGPRQGARALDYLRRSRPVDRRRSAAFRPLVIFLLSTGARLSEALYLEWGDVDLSRAHVVFRPTDARGIKTDEARGVPLPRSSCR